jgi:hypothetical protein
MRRPAFTFEFSAFFVGLAHCLIARRPASRIGKLAVVEVAQIDTRIVVLKHSVYVLVKFAEPPDALTQPADSKASNSRPPPTRRGHCMRQPLRRSETGVVPRSGNGGGTVSCDAAASRSSIDR